MGQEITKRPTSPAPHTAAQEVAKRARTARTDLAPAASSGFRPAKVMTVTAGLVAVVALVLAALGPGRPASAGRYPQDFTAAAPEEASATLLSGYSAKGRAVTPGSPQVLAASVQVRNPTDAEQRYRLILTFAGPDGRTLLQRRLLVDVAAGQFVSRQLFTQAERPDVDVSVHLSADRLPGR